MCILQPTITHQAFDSAQSAHELTLRNSELETQLKQHVAVIGSKVEQLENMEVKLQRANEDAATFRKRIEKYKNRENASIADEVLLEEIKTYKVCDKVKQRFSYKVSMLLDKVELSLLQLEEEGYSVNKMFSCLLC